LRLAGARQRAEPELRLLYAVSARARLAKACIRPVAVLPASSRRPWKSSRWDVILAHTPMHASVQTAVLAAVVDDARAGCLLTDLLIRRKACSSIFRCLTHDLRPPASSGLVCCDPSVAVPSTAYAA
jgi:hypothetical protein